MRQARSPPLAARSLARQLPPRRTRRASSRRMRGGQNSWRLDRTMRSRHLRRLRMTRSRVRAERPIEAFDLPENLGELDKCGSHRRRFRRVAGIYVAHHAVDIAADRLQLSRQASDFVGDLAIEARPELRRLAHHATNGLADRQFIRRASLGEPRALVRGQPDMDDFRTLDRFSHEPIRSLSSWRGDPEGGLSARSARPAGHPHYLYHKSCYPAINHQPSTSYAHLFAPS